MLENNPGINSMRLDINYDESAMQLVGVEDSGNLGMSIHQNDLTSPYVLCWANDISDYNFTANGVIATLVFVIKDNTECGKYPITITYDSDNYDIYNTNGKQINFVIQNGCVNVINPVLLGDVNSDGTINIYDRILLSNYIKDSVNITINKGNSDLNCDGIIDQNDYYILAYFLMNKDGYDELPVLSK